jgi:hypothetical protein
LLQGSARLTLEFLADGLPEKKLQLSDISMLLILLSRGDVTHALDRLHDNLEPDDVEVRIEVLYHSNAGCPCIGHFRSPDGWVTTGTISRKHPGETHHADAVGLIGMFQETLLLISFDSSLQWSPDWWKLLMM